LPRYAQSFGLAIHLLDHPRRKIHVDSTNLHARAARTGQIQIFRNIGPGIMERIQFFRRDSLFLLIRFLHIRTEAFWYKNYTHQAEPSQP